MLLVEVDRRVDDEAAELDDARAVLLDQLVLDVVEEVALAAAAEVVGRVDAEAFIPRGQTTTKIFPLATASDGAA